MGVDVLPACLMLAIRIVQTGNDLRSAAARERRSAGQAQDLRKLSENLSVSEKRTGLRQIPSLSCLSFR
jgi:hypothetical protein